MVEYHMEEEDTEEPRGGGCEAPTQPLLPPLEARETGGGGMELAAGAHQDMVALEGVGEDLQDVEERGHHQGMEEGLGARDLQMKTVSGPVQG